MDKDYFMNGGGGIPTPWSGGMNCTSSDQSFIDPNSVTSHFDSSFTSMPSSAVYAAASEAFILRELIGKLGGGGIGSSIAFPATATPFSGAHNTTPPPPPPPPLHSLSGDPGFAERAAKFSCFGSRSFNGRTAAFEMMNDGGGGRSATPPADMHMHRVSSSPCLNPPAAAEKKKISLIRQQPQVEYNNNSNEESSVSDQIPSGETLSKNSNELNSSRKRKSVSRTKDRSINPSNNKRTKDHQNKDEGDEEEEDNEDEKSKEKTKDHQKPPEPPKDYIHVRARRGQATDSHSLAERVRREKISERMKLLQDLVPGCNKVTGKALMLDEIINYVQSLQRQVEFLSMKLSSVNPGLDFSMENLLLSKDNNTSVPQQMYPLDSSSPPLFHQNAQQLQNNNNNNNISNNNNNNSTISVEPIIHIDHATLCRNLGIQLPCLDRFTHDILPQFPGFSEDDLQSIVQMGFAQNPANFSTVQNQTSNMKVER
ncbi:hypothetical protein ABFX02_04G217600 [Erythranthe guttata]